MTVEKRFYSNVVGKEKFQAIAKKTLGEISDCLSQSIGYYGSTSILEDNVLGYTVTKDGYTILTQLRFASDDTIANMILSAVKDISRSLVMEVGDGSTSAVVTTAALFDLLSCNEEKDKGFLGYSFKESPSKVVIDTLNDLGTEIKARINKKAIPITEENFERLKDIASISNNNDNESGDIIYNIYKEIGKNGFIILEKGRSEENDYYEITNGIETSFGLVDKVFSNLANQFESDYKQPKILMFDGQLTRDDINWFAEFLAAFLTTEVGVPLVIIATGYDIEFLNFLKINYQSNSRANNVQMGVTTFSSSKKEEFKDLAVYLNANIIDSEDASFEDLKDTFLKKDPIKATLFIKNDLGSAKRVFMNMNFTRFIEGTGSKEDIDNRVEFIQRELTYIKENQAKYRDINKDIHRLEKRIANLQAKIAKLYITGKTDKEIETRKYLFEDAIYASKSALEHGYIAGGNLAVAREVRNMLEEDKQRSESDKHYDALATSLLYSISHSFQEVYSRVLKNSGKNLEEIDNILDLCILTNSIYDVKEESYTDLNETRVINSVMTDIRIMESVFSIIGLLVTSNQYITKMPSEFYLD